MEQDERRKRGGQGAKFQESIRKNEYACRVEGVFMVLDCTACPYLKVAGLTRKIQSLSEL